MASHDKNVKETDFLLVSWLCATVEVNKCGKIKVDEFYSEYESQCKYASKTAVTKSVFSGILNNVFPHVTISRRRSASEKDVRIRHYVGISYKDKMAFKEEVSISDISNYLDEESFVTLKKDSFAKVFMQTGVLINGNAVMKEILFDFGSKTWQLKVHGKKVDLQNLELSEHFDRSVKHLKEILYVVKQLKSCTGLEVVDKKTVPVHIIVENVCLQSDGNSQKTMRSEFCAGILGWLCRGNACLKCIKYLNIFKNSKEQQENFVNLSELDENDLSSILKYVFPGASEEMKIFLQNQHSLLNVSDSRLRRWDKSIIKTCLNLWTRSPRSYNDLKDSNIFTLPSGRQLQRYKNIAPQNAGINPEVFRWMHNTARNLKLPLSGYHGGLIHDETKIQEDLVMNVKGKENKLIGFIDTGEEAQSLKILKEKSVQQSLATEVLQLSFLGYTGFRFPIAHYPTGGVTASELYIIVWDVISNLQSIGFTVDYILQDGGDQNRQFMKIHFDNDDEASSKEYMSANLVNPLRKIAHSQDFSHNVKKLRNAVLSSGIHQYNTRKMMKGEHCIVWDHWIDAAKWDENTNSRKIHYKLSFSHLHPDSSEKMRNHLAEEVLNNDMLNLMQQYQGSLRNGSILDSTIEFLQQTSQLISVFRDGRPIISVNDSRLVSLKHVLAWFKAWQKEVEQTMLSSKEKEKRLPSKMCMHDVESLIVTFINVCDIHISEFPGEGVYPSRYNSDIIENNFCQIRGLHNGNATHPTYNTYTCTMNSVILGQSSRSRGRKSNAGCTSADPYSFDVAVPLSKKRKVLGDISNTSM